MIENMQPDFVSNALKPASSSSSSKAIFVPADTGEAYWVMGTLFTYLVTAAESGGSYFTLIVDVGPEQGPPPHIHHLEEEQFYVLEGQLTYSIGDQTFQVNTGDFIHIPRGTIHSGTEQNPLVYSLHLPRPELKDFSGKWANGWMTG